MNTAGVWILPGPGDTDRLGGRLAGALCDHATGLIVSLAGELGAGKTALTRATLRGLGHAGPVVSPSYTLVEPYDLGGRRVYHVDLYRLADPSELELLGLREVDTATDWLFVEWAAHGGGFLPAPDLQIRLDYANTGREARFAAYTERGTGFIKRLEQSR